MADTRLPDRWLSDAELQAMSDDGWRFFTTALMFCNRMESDGLLRDVELRFLPIDTDKQAIDEVLATGRLTRVEGGFQFRGWGDPEDLGQTTKESLMRQREGNRNRKAEQRKREKEAKDEGTTTSTSHGVSHAVTPGVSHGTPGRKEKAPGLGTGPTGGDHVQSASEQPIDGWPTKQPGEGGRFPLPPYDGTNAREAA